MTNILGLEELRGKIVMLLESVRGKQQKKIWMQAALELRDAIRDYAPIHEGPITYYTKGMAPRTVEPGALRSAIFAAYGKDEENNVLVGVNDQIAPHGKWIEYGTSKTAAQPYFRPALALTQSRCISIMAEGYRRLLVEMRDVPEPSSPEGSVSPPTIREAAVRLVNTLRARRSG